MYTKILVPLDGSDLAECVLPHLENILGCGDVKEVVFIQVTEPFHKLSGFTEYNFTDDDIKEVNTVRENKAREYLDRVIGRLNHSNVKLTQVVIPGKTADCIADFVTNSGVDLVIISTHGRSGISRWALGSIAQRLVSTLCIPVMMVRAPGCVAGI